MKNSDIKKIRNLLQEASLRYFKGEDKVDNLISQALDLLPCETCNGTGTDITFRSRGFGMANAILVSCPDCS